MHAQQNNDAAIGVMGGSGLYAIDGLEHVKASTVATPFGDPSDPIVTGVLAGRRICFLPRHGVGHRLMPHEINHRANIWALRSLGVRWVIAVSAVGSLREHLAPRDIVVPDQLIDRTGSGSKHTLFGAGIVAHVGFADPYCNDLRSLLLAAARKEPVTVHERGTYLCMNGPAFSTRAEAAMHRQIGADIIGMTNGPEARLCREAEISLATMAMVTDYDCWKDDEAPVDGQTVVANLQANSLMAIRILRHLIPNIPTVAVSPSHRALDTAIFTSRKTWPETTTRNLAPILGRFL